MREIKFRAWDKTLSKMIRGEKTNDKFLIRNDGIYGGSSEVELMQYTGLKDKNGVEIYEGDIATYDSSSKKGWIIEVEWDSESGAWLPFNDYYHIQDEQGDWFEADDNGNIFEVIGNIYENPELLDKE